MEETKNKIAQPCVLIIFGATGDLTRRRLGPAIYNLEREGLLPSKFACVGFARREWSHETLRNEMRKSVDTYSRVKPIDESIWNTFQEKLYFHSSTFDDNEGYIRLKNLLEELDKKHGTQGNRVFYLSTQPSDFPLIAKMLHAHGLIYDSKKETRKFSRMIIEKPFGHDLNSAKALQKELINYLSEDQIFRIDHYLGKETVQNLLVFRFANSIFESLWHKESIDNVQITVAEDIGIGTRGNFWEEAGILRDIVQNHVMQLLSLVAMEPPKNLAPDSIRDEKVKVLEAIRPLSSTDIEKSVLRAQYTAGRVHDEDVKGYLEEQYVDKNSVVGTYMCMRLFIDNARWKGVPFYLRAGKRLPKRVTEIAVTFKKSASGLFDHRQEQLPTNVLVIRIQPDEGISLKINSKVPGNGNIIKAVEMDFRYSTYFGLAAPEAYERLICDCMCGDSTLFARDDEVMHAWRICTPILEAWAKSKGPIATYSSGSWGPVEADRMISQEGRSWRTP